MSDLFKEKQVYPFWVIISIAIILGMSPFILVDIMEESNYLIKRCSLVVLLRYSPPSFF